MKFSILGQQKVTSKYRWLLNRGNSNCRLVLCHMEIDLIVQYYLLINKYVETRTRKMWHFITGGCFIEVTTLGRFDYTFFYFFQVDKEVKDLMKKTINSGDANADWDKVQEEVTL